MFRYLLSLINIFLLSYLPICTIHAENHPEGISADSHEVIKLSLKNGDFTSLPPEIGEFVTLQELDLSNNKLRSLPPEIGRLANLEVLNLKNNKLKSLPPEIGRLTNLKELYLGSSSLHGNELTSLPPEIGMLKRLQILDLRKNRITSLPPEIGNLKKLLILIISNNRFNANQKRKIRDLLPKTYIKFDSSGKFQEVRIDRRPDSIKTKAITYEMLKNQSILESIKLIINSNPQLGISISDFQRYELENLKRMKDSSYSREFGKDEEVIDITKEQIKYRLKFLDFLRKKLRELNEENKK